MPASVLLTIISIKLGKTPKIQPVDQRRSSIHDLERTIRKTLELGFSL